MQLDFQEKQLLWKVCLFTVKWDNVWVYHGEWSR